jgi:hypothetical protein
MAQQLDGGKTRGTIVTIDVIAFWFANLSILPKPISPNPFACHETDCHMPRIRTSQPAIRRSST